MKQGRSLHTFKEPLPPEGELCWRWWPLGTVLGFPGQPLCQITALHSQESTFLLSKRMLSKARPAAGKGPATSLEWGLSAGPAA